MFCDAIQLLGDATFYDDANNLREKMRIGCLNDNYLSQEK